MLNFRLMWKFKGLPNYGPQNVLRVFVLPSLLKLEPTTEDHSFHRGFSTHSMNSRGGSCCENTLYY